jgi:hypothetical protein
VVNRPRSASERKRTFGTSVLKTLGRQRWLDRPSYRLEHSLTFLFAACGRHRDRVANALHGTWLGQHVVKPTIESVTPSQAPFLIATAGQMCSQSEGC